MKRVVSWSGTHSSFIFSIYGSIPKDLYKNQFRGFPGGAVVENPPANAGDTGSSPGLGGSHMPRSK